MAVSVIKRTYNKEHDGVLNPSQIYIVIDVKSGKGSSAKIQPTYFRLSEIRWQLKEKERHDEDGISLKRITSFEQFEELKKNSDVHFYLPDKDAMGEDVYKNSGYVKKLSDAIKSTTVIYPESYVNAVNNFSTVFDESKKTGLLKDIYNQSNADKNATTIENGSRFSMSLSSKDWSKDDAYVMVVLEGETKPTFILKSELVKVQSSGKDIKLTEIAKKDIEGSVIAVKGSNHAVKEIFIEKEFVPGVLNSYEITDFVEMREKTYTLLPDTSTSEIDTIVAETSDSFHVTSSVEIDRYFSSQTPVEIEVPNPKDPKKPNKIYQIKSINYENSPNGEFIKVQPKGTTAETVVNLANVYESNAEGSQINPENLLNYIGKKLFVKEGDVFFEILPLTKIQASIKFSEIKSLQPIQRHEEVQVSEDTYIKDKNGTLLKESELAKPIGYKVLDAEATDDFDCYNIPGPDGNFFVVDKHVFDSKSYVENFVDGKKIRLNLPKNPIKLKRCANLAEADVIQTTSLVNPSDPEYKVAINKCKVVNNESRREDIKEATDEFTNQYVAGNYYLPTVVYNNAGQRIELGKDRQRYEHRAEVYSHDYAHDNYPYNFNNVEYLTENGKMDLKGGVKYSAKDATKNVLGKFFVTASVINTALLGSGGIIGVLAGVFVSLPLTVASFAVTAPVVAIANKIIEFNKNRVPFPVKSKTKLNQPKWEKNTEEQLSADLESLLEYTKLSTIDQEQAIQKIQATFQSRKTDIALLSASRFNANFELENDKVLVNENNASAVAEFMCNVQPIMDAINAKKDEEKKLKDKLAKYTKKGKKAKAEAIELKLAKLADELADLEMKKDIAMAERKEGIAFKSHPSCAKLDRQAKLAQAYVLLKGGKDGKGIGLTKEQLAEFGITDEIVNIINQLEYDPKTKQLTKDGKPIDELMEENDLFKSEIDKLRGISLGGDKMPDVLIDPSAEAEEEFEAEEEAGRELGDEEEVTPEEVSPDEINSDEEEDRVLDEDQINQLENEINALKDKVKEYEEKIAELESKGEKDSKEIRKLKEDKLFLEEQIAMLKETIARLEKKCDLLSTLKAEADFLISRQLKTISILEQENLELSQYKNLSEQTNKRIEELEKELETNKKLSAKEIAELKKEIKSLKNANAKLESIIAEKDVKIAQLEDSYKELEQKCESLEETIKAQTAEIERLRGVEEKLLKSKGDIKALKAERDELNARLAVLDAENKAKIGEINKLSSQIQTLTAKIEEQNKTILELTEKNAYLQGVNDRLTAENEELKREREELIKANSMLSKMIIITRTRINDIISKIDQQLESHRKFVEQINAKITTLTAKYNKILQRIQSEEKSSELKAEVVTYRKEIAKLISEIEVKRAEIVKIQTQIDQSSEGYGDEDEEGKQFKEKVKASKKVSVDIKADYNTAYKKATEISTIDYEEELNKQEINTRINSEAKLKDLLTKKDSDLLNYLKANGVNLAESDIREIVTRIINKHAEGKTATAYSKNLKNTKVHDALVMGQLFITKVETNELNVDDGVGV